MSAPHTTVTTDVTSSTRIKRKETPVVVCACGVASCSGGCKRVRVSMFEEGDDNKKEGTKDRESKDQIKPTAAAAAEWGAVSDAWDEETEESVHVVDKVTESGAVDAPHITDSLDAVAIDPTAVDATVSIGDDGKDHMTRVKEDVAEVNLIKGFYAHCAQRKGIIHVRLSMAVTDLHLDTEWLRAWQLDPKRHIVVALSFSQQYWLDSRSVKIRVGHSPDAMGVTGAAAKGYSEAHIPSATTTEDLEPLHLGWMLANHIRKDLLPTFRSTLVSKKYSLESATEVVETLGVPLPLAITAVVATHNEASAAISALLEPIPRAHYEQDAMKTVGAATVEALADSSAYTNLFTGHNYLVRILMAVRSRILTCNKQCLVCGSALEWVGMKPTVCDGALCRMGFEEMSLGYDLGAEIIANPAVVDLYISLAASAVSHRWMQFVSPASVRAVDPVTKSEVNFLAPGPVSAAGTPRGAPRDKAPAATQTPRGAAISKLKEGPPLNYHRILTCLSTCPSVEEMAAIARSQGTAQLKRHLTTLDPLLYGLLFWIMTSARTHLRLLTREEKISGIPSEWQFVMVSASPEAEARFQAERRQVEDELKKRKETETKDALPQVAETKTEAAGTVKPAVDQATFFAWHGSDTSNWHSILRTGLRNLSHTKYMTSGAVYGAGIYMATDSATSLDYCKSSGGWSRSRFGASIKCLALCEVIHHPSLAPPKPFWVIPNEEWTSTRFLIVLPEKTSMSVRASSILSQLPHHLLGRHDVVHREPSQSPRDDEHGSQRAKSETAGRPAHPA